ncbi:MAG: ATP-dependent DNA ligase [Catenulispora sp. 13_1_20CM_3_70_7]|nr:MAG: ATP-dependent DNA ligase [Catenulispora sp. 13_1_20CM_3_70_7]
MAKGDVEVEVESRKLKLTNLDKLLYPVPGFTKAQVIDYYTRIAPVLLPHLKNRPLTLKRYPNGVDEEFFYEKNCPKHRPPWISTAKVWSWGNDRWMDYCVVDDLPSLVWVANLASLELHTSLSLGKKIEEPRMMVYDLDPGPPANIVDCCQVGIWLRDYFADFGLKSFAKTSGSKGLQLYIPLNSAVDYSRTKGVSKGVAQQFEREKPKQVVSQQLKTLREGKVLIDWSQNDQYKTTVNVYSLRAREHPTVSTPVTWDEVEECLSERDPMRLRFTADAVLERVSSFGDLFEPVLSLKQKLSAKLPTTETKKRAPRAGGGRSRQQGQRRPA